MTFGEKFKAEREKKNLTQQQVRKQSFFPSDKG